MDDSANLYEFVRIGEVAETTTHLLSLSLQYKAAIGEKSSKRCTIDPVEQMVLQQARDYLSTVKEGFTLSVRTNQTTSAAELRFLIDRVMLDWSALSAELGFDDDPSSTNQTDFPSSEQLRLESLQTQLLAYGMASVALGHLPRLTAEQITFPYSHSQPPTYADIPTPTTAGEMLWRIEELEQTVWRIMAGELQEVANHRYGSLRRTYGFFETSAILASRQSERFGVKKRTKQIALFS